jgi:hypothetical protein
MGLVGDGISVAIKDRVKSRGFNNHDYINTPKEEYI